MYCRFCGKEIEASAKYCDRCGGIVTESETDEGGEIYAPEVISSYCEAELETAAKKSLIFGILSLAFGSVVGFILALIGMKHVRKYTELNGGYVNGKAKAGKILSTIGIPFGVFSLLYRIAMFKEVISALTELGIF